MKASLLSKKQNEKIISLPIDIVFPNNEQPRTIFDEEKINELAESIRSHGILQPIIVRKNGDVYEIVAGERRYRAIKRLGIKYIPAIIKKLDDKQSASIAIIENIQRENLTAIEEANAYKKIMDLDNVTQEQLAGRLGKSQSTIANKIRLLNLPEIIQQAVLNKNISERHARALLSVKELKLQIKIFEEVIKRNLTVKETEKLVKSKLEQKMNIRGKSTIITKIPKDVRMVLNTFNQAISLVERTGIDIESDLSENGEYYTMTVKIPKNK